jgi:uncharacterized membrane protein
MAEPKNPYAAPSAHVADIAGSADDGQLIEGGQTVPAGNGWLWIADGFNLFKMNPVVWIVNLIILVVIMIALALIPFLGALGTYILLPIFTGGLMLGCHALTHNEPLEVGHLFAGFREKGGPLAMVGVLYLVGLILIMLVASLFVGFGLFGAIFTGAKPAMSVTMILLAGLIVLGLSVPLAMAIWFAPALVVFHDLQPMDAMKQSFSGCLKNIVPFLVYGILGLVIGIVAFIPFGLGWLVWGPTLVASVYTGYRDIFVQPA